MKNKNLLMVLMVLVVMLSGFNLGAQKVVGYWPFYVTGINSISYSHYTDIVYAFINPTSTGDLNFNDGRFNQSEFNNLVSQCNSNGVKPHLSIGGAGLSDEIAAVAANSAYRAKFVAQIVSFVAGKHTKNSVPIAGLDVDWEFPTGVAQKQNHLALIKELRVALNNQSASDGNTYELAIAVGGTTPNMPANLAVYHTDYFDQDVIDHVDYIYIMNYDMGSSGYPNSHHSPYQGCVDAFTYFTTILGYPPSKLLMGLPFYGRSSSDAKAWKGFANTANFNDPDGVANGYTYNSKPIIDQKVSYVCSNGGAGVLVWEISQDASTPSLSLSKALSEAFAANNCPIDTSNTGGPVVSNGDCVSATSFNDDYDQTFTPSDGNIKLGYWGEEGGVYEYTRTGAGDLEVKVTQAANGWSPMGFIMTDADKTMGVDVSSTNQVKVSLTNQGSSGVEVYFTFISNNILNTAVTASGNGVLFGGILAAGATMNRTFDLSAAKKHQWVGAGGPCAEGTLSGAYCLTDKGFDPTKLTGIEFSINGEGANIGGSWTQPAINDHPIIIHYIRGGSDECDKKDQGSGGDELNIADGVKDVLFSVYPNPAAQILQVVYQGLNVSPVQIIDVNGKVVYQGSIGGGNDKLSIDLSHCSPGVYMVKLVSESNALFEKVMLR